MRNPVSGTQFRRDVKLAQKRGKDMAKLREVILLLIEGRPLPPRYQDHFLRQAVRSGAGAGTACSSVLCPYDARLLVAPPAR